MMKISSFAFSVCGHLSDQDALDIVNQSPVTGYLFPGFMADG
jgi:hypothetical protein